MKISVLTPSYNTGKYLERAIQSVIAQNYDKYEHIIVDGGSTDNSIDLFKKYDEHLQWVSEPDLGQSDAMNKAFNMSTGDIIVYLNADDEFAPGAFKEVIKVFRSKPGTDMVVGNLVFINPEGSSIRVPSHRYQDILQYWLNLFPNNPVSYFYTRNLQTILGEFPVDDHYAMDIWFLLRAYKEFNIVKIDRVLGTFHSDGTNKTAVKIAEVGSNLHRVVKTHLKTENKVMIPYFYFKFLMGRVKRKNQLQ
ncbi:hypothetical protein BEL04_04560 [Mucilaginibacter sp. PPCGB 2223]|uniref:glycosyltransferase family 2 protein n=1 Tax=Mucilaginibacter sp. PPCGB 2223 TaxID=1886027 RepID=UPI000823FDC0|nr:glycosyltransferase family 2 protein [Mucilaginibacter sp. PPCGB 2223]OCX53571.1 hypothetical protein BEL04_04560 [Mucilaginibacter sp. PPCGB 2223]